jgi:hypothetical protein
MEAVQRHRLPIGIRTGAIYDVSRAIGLCLNALRGSDLTSDGRKLRMLPDRKQASRSSPGQAVEVKNGSRPRREMVQVVQSPPETEPVG